MKRRVRSAICLAGIVTQVLCAWANQATDHISLPDFDARKAASPRPPAALAAPAPVAVPLPAAQAAALAALRQRVPDASVSRDPIAGSPRLVTVPEGFLTGRNGLGGAVSPEALAAFPATDPHRIPKAFINEHAALFGHDASALDAAIVRRDYRDSHNGLRTVVWQQTFEDVPVFNGFLKSHLTARDELVNVSSAFLASPALAAAQGTPNWSALLLNPALTPEQAINRAAADLGDAVAELEVEARTSAENTKRSQIFRSPHLKGDCYVELAWLPMDPDSMRLCWKVYLVSPSRHEAFRTLVDAETGSILVRHNLTCYQAPVAVSMRVYTSDSPSPFSPGWSTPNIGQPPVIQRTYLTNFTALNAAASPAGWVYPATNGVLTTVGNNVDSHVDWDDNDTPDQPRLQVPQDAPDFSFPLDLNAAPSAYTNAAVVNLFYWNNFMHDRLYALGFTEAAGNFQNFNFGRGGFGGDAVLADAQDGYALNDPFFHANNANFATYDDGVPGRMQMYIFNGPVPARDGDLDAEIICHEYTHGLSNRLVGGGTLISALQTRGMGEGWSDFYGLCLLSEDADNPNACYAVGGYATYKLNDLEENYYYGIRRYPYSTDFAKNPLTFKDIDPLQADPHIGIPANPVYRGMEGYAEEVHFQGEVWCAMLWECRAYLVDSLGWAEGNAVVLQLVTDGMKLSPPNPTFIEARDAILKADQVNYGSANRNELWFGFAKRGLGVDAQAPDADTTIGVVEDFDVPPDVVVTPPDGILEITVTPADNATVRGGTATPVFVRVRDGTAVTNATVTGLVNGLTQLTFGNRGVPPDARANDSTYSATLNVPSTGTNITLTLTVTAPGKTSATNTVRYYIALPPANDLFGNAIKVKADGATLAGNNAFADPNLETGEPGHGGNASAVSSVWWSWTPTSNSRVLIDTGGSKFNTLLGVYTGSAVNNLKQVAAAQTLSQQRQAYVQFDAKRGTNYFIAVASSSTNNTGQIAMRVTPGGIPDITPPVVNISTPVNGLIVVSNSTEVVTLAVDPGPISSGVDRLKYVVRPITVRESSAPPTGNGESTNRVALTQGRNTISVTAVDVVGNQSDAASVTVIYRPQPVPNDHFVYAAPLAGASGAAVAYTALATREPGEPKHAANDGGHSVWWKYTPSADGSLLVSTEGSNFDTVLGLYTGSRVDLLRTVAANDDAFDNSKFSKLQQGVRSNQTYYVAVDGFNGSTGAVQLAYSFAPGALFTINLQTTTGGSVAEHDSGSVDVPVHSAQTLTAVPALGYVFAGWEGDYVGIANPLSVQVDKNMTLKAVFRPVWVADDFETGNLSRLAWVTGGAKPWTVNTNVVSGGSCAARSGAVGNAQSSTLSLSVRCTDGAAAFDVKVSSEEGWDYFVFFYDGIEALRLSGEADWTRYSFPVSAGTHSFEWRYVKDNQTSVGLDAAFIDNFTAPIVPPVTPASVPTLSFNRLPQGQYELRLEGETNQVYVLYQTSDAPPDRTATWRSFATNVAYYGEIRLFFDPANLTAPRTFYRALAR